MRLRIEHHAEEIQQQQQLDHDRTESSCSTLNKSMTIYSANDLTRNMDDENDMDNGYYLNEKTRSTPSRYSSSSD